MSNFDIENLQPVNGRVLLEVIPEEEEYKGSLHIAPQSKEKSFYGIVKRVYKEYDGKRPFLKEGDTVIFPLHSGGIYYSGTKYDTSDNKKEYRVIKEEEIIGIL